VPAPQPILPAYAGASIRGIVPALFAPRGTSSLPSWFAEPVVGARQVVLLVLDGLGWEQLRARPSIAPTMHGMTGGPITSVAPSTTATALTSITTGLTPGEHGVVGYRMEIRGDLMNTLRWTTKSGDARRVHLPTEIQPFPTFLGEQVVISNKVEFETTGFTQAHLRGVRQVTWRLPSNIVVDAAALLAAGERFVYLYYDGIDKVAHEKGFGDYYDAELRTVDRLVGDLLAVLPAGAVLLVTADHGQVSVGANDVTPAAEVLAATRAQSGEGRFRWLHARSGAAADLLQAAVGAHGHHAWVVSRQQAIDDGWFGPVVSPPIAARYGDVALVPFEPISFDDPADSGPYTLICRHGSLTSAEMLVPFLAARRS
jgi:Type I phosphodiesterase / nucleotide pyrophosphatase